VTDEADREIYDYDVDDEGTIIQLGDWYHQPSSVLLEQFLSVRFRLSLVVPPRSR
jgi:hypothetical protein